MHAALRDFCAPAREDNLAALPMEYSSGVRIALQSSFEVQASDAGLGRYVERLLASFVVGSARLETHVLYRVMRGVAGYDRWYVAYAESERISNTGTASVVFTHLLSHLNHFAAGAVRGLVPLHAGAVAVDGRAVVLGAPTESGKTTLVGGLCERGAEYLSDEVSALGLDLRVHPYPKPLSVDPGSWGVLEQLRPAEDLGVPDVASHQWHVLPSQLPHGWCRDPVPVVAVVAPRWTPGAPTVLEPASRAMLLLDLLRDGFKPRLDVAEQMHLLELVLSSVPCLRLTWSDMDEACAAVTRLLTGSFGAAGPLRTRASRT